MSKEYESKVAGLICEVLASYGISLQQEEALDWIETPPNQDLGDFAFPCFRFAKSLQIAPAKIAEEFAAKIAVDIPNWLEKAEPKGPFLNFFVNKQQLAANVIPKALDGSLFKVNDPQDGVVVVEFSQPNTHKVFHVGHLRNVCLGDAIVRLHRYLGYQVRPVNYIGDEGTHVAECLWHLNRSKETAPDSDRSHWLESHYASAKALLAEADPQKREIYQEEIAKVHRALEEKTEPEYSQWLETRQWCLDAFDEIYSWLDVSFEKVYFESEMTADAQKIVDEYYKKGLFKLDQGTIGIDLNEYDLGYAILRKSNGATLYLTKDLALAKLKYDTYRPSRSLYIVAQEQNLHFQQCFKILELMSFPGASNCQHLSYGFVRIPGGKMSTRKGNAIHFDKLRQTLVETLLARQTDDQELTEDERTERVDRLARGAVRYGMLQTDPNREIIFQLEDWLSVEGNTGPYQMYTYARAGSILSKAEDKGYTPNTDNLGLLTTSEELALCRQMYDFNATVTQAAENLRPSALANYLYYFCKDFNRFYSHVKILNAENIDLIEARLALVAAVKATLFKGQNLLGMTPPERM